MAGVKGRSGGFRPGAGRKPGTKNPETIKRDALMASLTAELPALAKSIDTMLVHVANERQMRHNQAQLLPSILRRLTEIEKHLALREAHRGPTVAATKVFRNATPEAPPNSNNPPSTAVPRARVPAKHAEAEALFKPAER
jgi:hypothetical protein